MLTVQGFQMHNFLRCYTLFNWASVSVSDNVCVFVFLEACLQKAFVFIMQESCAAKVSLGFCLFYLSLFFTQRFWLHRFFFLSLLTTNVSKQTFEAFWLFFRFVNAFLQYLTGVHYILQNSLFLIEDWNSLRFAATAPKNCQEKQGYF